LRYYGDCSLDEIATALGCRSGTVRATLHQALKRLRALAGHAGVTAAQRERPGRKPLLPPSAGMTRVVDQGDDDHAT
jgi:Sigma-70, region 4